MDKSKVPHFFMAHPVDLVPHAAKRTVWSWHSEILCAGCHCLCPETSGQSKCRSWFTL